MWWRFGHDFVEGYVLRENIWLYTRPLFGPSTKSPLFALRVVAVGMLPWTPVLAGRLVDLARGQRASTRERLLWVWAVAVTLFFSFSHFTLDHYLYPATPALCLLAADAWCRLRRAESLRPHAATLAGVVACALVMVGAGVAGSIAARDLAWWAGAAAVACGVGGLSLIAQMSRARMRPPAIPVGLAAGLLVPYSVVLMAALPEIEQAKPAKALAQAVAATLPDARVATYHLDRWTTSVHFYAARPVDDLNTPQQVDAFLRTPGSHYFVMPRADYDELRAANHPLSIVHEREGLSTVTARVLRKDRRRSWQSFVVATDAPGR
jgi:4-amino-4-deoxy-L-arabinose transferase-like glycosyltransferase